MYPVAHPGGGGGTVGTCPSVSFGGAPENAILGAEVAPDAILNMIPTAQNRRNAALRR